MEHIKIPNMKHHIGTVMLDDTIQGIELLIDGKKDNKRYFPIDEAFAITEYILFQIYRTEGKGKKAVADTFEIITEWRKMLISQLKEKENGRKIDS